jgi:hypothetical protein
MFVTAKQKRQDISGHIEKIGVTLTANKSIFITENKPNWTKI